MLSVEISLSRNSFWFLISIQSGATGAHAYIDPSIINKLDFEVNLFVMLSIINLTSIWMLLPLFIEEPFNQSHV